MNNNERSKSRSIARSKRDRLLKPRIPPLDKKEARKINKNLVDKSEWDKFVDPLIKNPVSKALFALNVYATLMREPDITMRTMMSFRQLSSKLSISERERELLILRIAWLCYSEYEWGNHTLMAKQAGITEEEINYIKKELEAHDWDPVDALLLKTADELYTDTFISDKIWKELNEHYNLEQIMDIIFLVGQYQSLAMYLNTFGVPLETNKKGFSD